METIQQPTQLQLINASIIRACLVNPISLYLHVEQNRMLNLKQFQTAETLPKKHIYQMVQRRNQQRILRFRVEFNGPDHSLKQSAVVAGNLEKSRIGHDSFVLDIEAIEVLVLGLSGQFTGIQGIFAVPAGNAIASLQGDLQQNLRGIIERGILIVVQSHYTAFN